MAEGDGYVIRPDGVRAVLDAVAGAAGVLLDVYSDMAEPIDVVSAAAGSSGIVSSALAEAQTWLEGRQAEMGARVERGVTGVTDAVAAYARGDHEMAATIVRRMEAAMEGPLPGCAERRSVMFVPGSTSTPPGSSPRRAS